MHCVFTLMSPLASEDAGLVMPRSSCGVARATMSGPIESGESATRVFSPME